MKYDPKVIEQNQLEPWRQHLLRAADYLVQHGWCQNAMFLPNTQGYPRACARGALNLTLSSAEMTSGQPAAYWHLSKHIGPYTVSIETWNDCRERTVGEVISTMRECALSKERV